MPRKKKTPKKRKRENEPLNTPKRPRKYRTWDEKSMAEALKAVREGMGVNRAALQHGVPKTTLKDRVSGRVVDGSNPGRAPYLTQAEEKELVSYILTCSKIGFVNFIASDSSDLMKDR